MDYLKKSLDFMGKNFQLIIPLYIIAAVPAIIFYATAGPFLQNFMNFENLNKMNMNFFHKQKTGDLVSRLESDSSSVLSFINIIFNSGLISLFKAIGIIAISLSLNWQITVSVIFAFPIYFISERYWSKKIKGKRKEVVEKSGDILHFLQEKIRMVKTTQLFNREEIEKKLFNRTRSEEEFALGVIQETYLARAKDDEILRKCQDGGVASALLIQALEDNLIDIAVTTKATPDNQWKPFPSLAFSRKEILESAGSSEEDSRCSSARNCS